MTNHARDKFEKLYASRNLSKLTDDRSRRVMDFLWNGNGYDDKHMDDCYFYYLAIEAVDPDVQINIRRQYDAGGE